MVFLLSLLVTAICLAASASDFVPATKEKYPFFHMYKECEKWTVEDNQCLDNIPFMWGSCITTCLDHMKDDHENCATWAREGECTGNPRYVHVHCPQSCQYGILWNPFARRELGIDEIPWSKYIPKEACEGVPTDMLTAAELVRERLVKIFHGAYNSADGISTAAPSEFLFMMGLAEGFLYVLRLQEAVVQYYGDTVLSTGVPASKKLLMLEETLAENIETVEIALQNCRWNSDTLMQVLPSWLSMLEQGFHGIIENCAYAHRLEVSMDGENALPIGHEEPNPSAVAIQTSCDRSYGPTLNNLHHVVGSNASPSSHHYNNENPTAQAVLSSGYQMPIMGLGTWMLDGPACELSVMEAIEMGYRMIDTAEAYRNEVQVGWGIKHALDRGYIKSREELFIATKLSNPSNAGYEKIKLKVRSQLKDLKLTYIDLYMLHSPLGDAQLQKDTWRGLEELVEEGAIRSLGVSNFDSNELQTLITTQVGTVRPAVVQNKLDVYHVGKQLDNRGDDLVTYAKEQGIKVVAYSSFSAYPFVLKPIDDPVVRVIAADHLPFATSEAGDAVSVTPAMVLLRWSMQKGTAVIPRSSDRMRLLENYNALYRMHALSEDEMGMLDALQLLVSSPISKAITW